MIMLLLILKRLQMFPIAYLRNNFLFAMPCLLWSHSPFFFSTFFFSSTSEKLFLIPHRGHACSTSVVKSLNNLSVGFRRNWLWIPDLPLAVGLLVNYLTSFSFSFIIKWWWWWCVFWGLIKIIWKFPGLCLILGSVIFFTDFFPFCQDHTIHCLIAFELFHVFSF